MQSEDRSSARQQYSEQGVYIQDRRPLALSDYFWGVIGVVV